MSEPGPISRFLSADHARLHDLLRKSTAELPRIELGSFDEFRAGLLRHIALEEKILLPALQEASGRPWEAGVTLRAQHGAIAALLVPPPDPEVVATLERILARHNELEEGAGGLYETADRALAERAEELVRRMGAYPEVPTSPYSTDPKVFPALCRALRRAGFEEEARAFEQGRKVEGPAEGTV